MTIEKEKHNLLEKVGRKEPEQFLMLRKRPRKKHSNAIKIILENLKFQSSLQSMLGAQDETCYIYGVVRCQKTEKYLLTPNRSFFFSRKRQDYLAIFHHHDIYYIHHLPYATHQYFHMHFPTSQEGTIILIYRHLRKKLNTLPTGTQVTSGKVRM